MQTENSNRIFELNNQNLIYYSTAAGEYNDGTEEKSDMSEYPIMPKELQIYRDFVWEEVTGCYLYMVKANDTLGIMVIKEFESTSENGVPFEEVQKKAELMANFMIDSKDHKDTPIYIGKQTGMKLLNDPEPRHELGMFFPIWTKRITLHWAIWTLNDLVL